MALGDVIARLAVSLSLETAALEKGATMAEKRFEQSRKKFEKIGGQMQGIGVKLSAALTAPLAGLGYALTRSATQLNDTAKQMKVAAQVAGEGYEDFQRLAFGAKTVGIEADKLGDIFKDVQDKVGDFRATGGGGMADFFENIAPKVGVTAEAFKGLSGKDGLQLYYDSLVKAGVSSDQMRFYMEAIASDATMLIPLLQNSGKAFDELGKSASVISPEDAKGLEEYALASQKMEAAFQTLTIAIVGSGLLEAVTGIVTQIAEWTAWLSEINPELLNWALGAGAVVAALGPVIGIIGTVVKVGAPFLTFLTMLAPAIGLVTKALLLLALNPVVLGIAALVAGIYYAWKNWDKIEPILRNLYNGVKTWISDKLGAVLEGVKSKIDAVKGWFFDLYDAVVGHSYVPDMVDGIADQMDRLDKVMVDKAATATKKTADAFKELAAEVQPLLDRLFPEAAGLRQIRAERDLIDRARKSGMLDPNQADEADRRLSTQGKEMGSLDDFFGGPLGPTGGVQVAIDKFGQVTTKMADKAEATAVRVVDSFKDMAEKTIASFQSLANAIKGGGFLDILSGVLDFGLQLGSIGAFGKKVQTNLRSVPAFANGTNFAPGGMALVGERGPELVDLPRGSRVTPNHELRQRSGNTINNYYGPGAQEFWGRIAAGDMAAAQAGGQIGPALMQHRSSRRVA